MNRLVVLGLVAVAVAIQACPQAVQSLCRCADLHNGVALDCSNQDGATVIETLKTHQAQLGLIQNLVMHKANIRAIPASFFSGLFIKRLDLSKNGIVKIDGAAFAGMSLVLQELSLTHNNLTEVPSDALEHIKTTLLKLDLSNNTIGDLTADKALPSMPKLYDLNLAYNKICTVHKSAMAGIRDSVQTINFGHNCLTAVPAPAIRGFKQLMSLHMHNNEIAQLDALSFMNLPVMNLLNLASNKIAEIKPQAFLNVPNLRYLYLTNNHITSLAAHQFSAFEQLEMLDLTNNYIESIPKSAFSGLGQLKQLYLGNNRISLMEADAFSNSSIAILILAANNLTRLDEGSLNGMPNVQQISLKDNHIASVHQNAFYNTPSIAMVDLSGNNLTDLPGSTFLTQLNLLLIDLSRNNIIKTPYGAFNRRVGTVMLQENPLVCTEKVHMLQDGVGVYIPNSEDIVCGGTPPPTTTHVPPRTTTHEKTADKAPIASTSETAEEPRNLEVLQNKLGFQADKSPQRIQFEEPSLPVPSFAQEQDADRAVSTFLDHHPMVEMEGQAPARPSILNIRPTNVVSRPRTRFGSEVQSGLINRLPSRENPFARTAVHVPVSAISTTVMPEEELPHDIAPALPAPTPSEQLPPHVPMPDVEDEALAKVLGAIDLPPTTTGLPTRSTTHISENPNIILPFPVPFLKPGPVLSMGARVKPTTGTEEGLASSIHSIPPPPRELPTDILEDEEVIPVEELPQENARHVPTLPPSIVLAPRRPAPVLNKDVDSNRIDGFQEFALKTEAPNEVATGAKEKTTSAGISPSSIIMFCLGAVFLAMILVFVCLCIAKHRNERRFRLGGSSSSDSTTARTNAYVAAQAAQMNMMYGTQGTIGRSRSMAGPHADEANLATQQPWIYSPSNYCTYYK